MIPLLARIDAIVPLVFALAIILASAFGLGCGGAPDAAWTTTVYTGAAVEAADLQVATEVERIQAETLAEAQAVKASQGEDAAVAWFESTFLQRVAKFDGVRTALRTAYQSLGALSFALSAWDELGAGEEPRWLQAAACSAAAIGGIARALDDAGLALPDALLRVVDMLTPYSEGLCPEGSTR
jgi:hypothetical protein